MTHKQILDVAENCTESRTGTDEHYCTCPMCRWSNGATKRRALIRRYSNDSASVHCMRGCNMLDILALWGLTLNALRGTDGKLPPVDPDWWRTPRRYDTRNPVPPMSER